MKIDWRNVQPRIKMVLAAVLVAALLITPSAVGPQVVQAQEAPAGRGQMAVVGASGATFYAAPQGDELGSLPLGTVLTATSRTADSTWIEVTTTEGDTGWVKRSEVVAFGLEKLPVSGSAAHCSAACQPPRRRAASCYRQGDYAHHGTDHAAYRRRANRNGNRRAAHTDDRSRRPRLYRRTRRLAPTAAAD